MAPVRRRPEGAQPLDRSVPQSGVEVDLGRAAECSVLGPDQVRRQAIRKGHEVFGRAVAQQVVLLRLGKLRPAIHHYAQGLQLDATPRSPGSGPPRSSLRCTLNAEGKENVPAVPTDPTGPAPLRRWTPLP